jgi:nicotinamidase/pyrazinamidase
MKLLLVIDMQNDFIDGALGTAEACAIVDNVVAEIDGWDGPVICTRDTHTEDYLDTQEGRNLPVVHCVKGTDGWQLNGKVAAAAERKNALILDKPSFGSRDLPAFIMQECGDVEEIELIGLCTDICVISNAMILKAFFQETPVYVKASCCAGVTPEQHETALAAMKPCQIKII